MRKKGFSSFLLIITVAVILGVAGSLIVFKKLSSKKNFEQDTMTQTTTVAHDTSKVTTDTQLDEDDAQLQKDMASLDQDIKNADNSFNDNPIDNGQ